MNNNNQLLYLDDLPNEIFHYGIFPFFSWQELYYSFFGLNKRINKILQSLTHLYFTVDSSNQHHPALSFFAPCIICLTVCLGQFDITPFSALRSLTLKYPSLQQRNSIRPENFPRLEYLNLSYPLEDSILLNFIFSNAFEHLKVCQFDRTSTDHSWNGSPKLRSLSISVYDSYGIICVLRACPNISRLNIIVYETPQKNLSLPRHSISCVNLLLQYLFIRSTFEILAAILKLTPNLKWLTFDDIRNYKNEKNPGLNFKTLASTLSILKQLSYLYFTSGISAWDSRVPLHTLHPLFKHVKYVNSSTVILSSSVI
ncbi:unnamed protein product [Rotaria sordida]|uniref:Uncharacterized protein n=1 Tax=Rotaria sordida TaxID=392033 RepID=A0A814EDH2_9BILA|nr:unnamed protein product [Rotaria sordida]CAF3744267.1 unnamed protein product [Rotaria sordida]